jgi:rare lipoprotein A
LNIRHEPRYKARFPRFRIAGFSPITLMIALALPVGFSSSVDASTKKTTKGSLSADSLQVGRASWYGPGFHGRKTASGQTFNQHALTAAHPRLPLGTRAQVTNLKNGRQVEVTINDRGPHRGGRIIDLSRAAAQRLAMGGTARVSVVALAD